MLCKHQQFKYTKGGLELVCAQCGKPASKIEATRKQDIEDKIYKAEKEDKNGVL